MKRLAILCGLAALLLCMAQNASAQYAGAIHRSGSDFVDDFGQKLSDETILSLVGEDIYSQTVVGARKQFSAGKGLILGGCIGFAAGFAEVIAAGFRIVQANKYSSVEEALQDDGAIAAMYLMGYGCMVLGSSAINAGIPLKIIGKSRLNWVENNYNENAGLAINAGLTPHGIGLVARF